MHKGGNLMQLIELPEISDDCYLYFAQTQDHIPFSIKRVFYILQADTKLPRGFHAHKKTKQVLFCLQGSIKMILDDGKKKAAIVLDKPNKGIFIDTMIWHEMHNFKKDTILLILTSKKFNPADYIRDYEEFKRWASKVS